MSVRRHHVAAHGVEVRRQRPYRRSERLAQPSDLADRLDSLRAEGMIAMTLPYCEPLVALESAVRVIPEPPRRGEPGGEPCAICSGAVTSAVWSDDLWTLHPPPYEELRALA